MENVLSDKVIHVADLFEQIEAVNRMISIHADDDFMRSQYEYRKSEFLKQLKASLKEFNIHPSDIAA